MSGTPEYAMVQMRHDRRQPGPSIPMQPVGGSRVSFQPESGHAGVHYPGEGGPIPEGGSQTWTVPEDDRFLIPNKVERRSSRRLKQRNAISVMFPSKKRISEFLMPSTKGTVPADLPIYICVSSVCCLAFGVYALFAYLDALRLERYGQQEKAAERATTSLRSAVIGIAIGPIVIISLLIITAISREHAHHL